MSDVRLRPMRQDEFGPWLEWLTNDYGREIARNKGIPAASALEESSEGMNRLLPRGIDTPSHSIEIAEDGTGDRIGFLWYAREPRGEREIVWLYEVHVDEPHRGRGYGRRLMELLEERARAAGVGRVALNVYADNSPARSLYESLGYAESARQMHKDLDQPGSALRDR